MIRCGIIVFLIFYGASILPRGFSNSSEDNVLTYQNPNLQLALLVQQWQERSSALLGPVHEANETERLFEEMNSLFARGAFFDQAIVTYVDQDNFALDEVASFFGFPLIVQKLIEANPKAQREKYHQDPLCFFNAVHNNDTTLIAVLLDALKLGDDSFDRQAFIALYQIALAENAKEVAGQLSRMLAQNDYPVR